jgi:hypothetical protein
LCKREVLGKRAPHSFTPPLNVVGVSNIIQERRLLGKKGKTTNPMLGMQIISPVQGFPSHKIQSEDHEQHPRGYNSRIHVNNKFKLR